MLDLNQRNDGIKIRCLTAWLIPYASYLNLPVYHEHKGNKSLFTPSHICVLYDTKAYSRLTLVKLSYGGPVYHIHM